ncbi:MAG TPA: CDP-archaeol synthase [Bradyrhizobium sp.]|nr:CDP-archaeol synthase [Bradyrhizobium sp.]
MQVVPILQALCLLTLANGTPVIVKKVLGFYMAFPLDAGIRFFDGRPLFGASKTIRGIVASILVTGCLAPLLGASVVTGGIVAVLAMIGDLSSSFVKRRLSLPPSTRALGLDQIPESLLPLLACLKLLSLTLVDVVICAVVFLVGELVISRLLYGLHVRDQPY